jgi:hypothetical protein
VDFLISPDTFPVKIVSFVKQLPIVCNYSSMLKLISAILLLFTTVFGYAQGSWNIGYLKADSINKSHVGKIVRIDFKSFHPWTSPDGRRHIRSYVETKDTGSVKIDTILHVFAERRKIYVDHGDYDDQYLECINCHQKTCIIYDAVIAALDEQSILFRVDLEIKESGKAIKKETKTIYIDRNKLDGVMYKL